MTTQNDLNDLIALAETRRLRPEDLDETIHDALARSAAQEINDGKHDDPDSAYDDAEETASTINNGGLSSQIQYLQEKFGSPYVRSLITHWPHHP